MKFARLDRLFSRKLFASALLSHAEKKVVTL
jgi:hypothetical protein